MLRYMKRRICLLLAAFLLLIPISAMADSSNPSPQIILLSDSSRTTIDLMREFTHLSDAMDNGFVKLINTDNIPTGVITPYNEALAGALRVNATDTVFLAKALDSELGTAKAWASTEEGADINDLWIFIASVTRPSDTSDAARIDFEHPMLKEMWVGLDLPIGTMATSLDTAEALHDTNIALAAAEGLLEGATVKGNVGSPTPDEPEIPQ